MPDTILTEDEFLKKTGLTTEELTLFKKYNLITPELKNNLNAPLYRTDHIPVIEKILMLREMGYEYNDIRKIIKKVGLPVKTIAPKNKYTSNLLTVGALAEQIGVNARTIKHWEDKGIFEPDTRSEGGFRLYREIYVFFGKLILDLQMFGYSLEDIKVVSDMFRDFVTIQQNENTYGKEESLKKVTNMLEAINTLNKKINQYKEGIERWEDLLKKKKKEIEQLKRKIEKKNSNRKKKSK